MSNWLSHIWQAIRRLWKREIIGGVVSGGLLVFLVREIVSGLIEDTFSERLVPWLSKSSTVSNWLLVVVSIGLILFAIAVLRVPKTSTWLAPEDVKTLKYAAQYLYHKKFLELLAGIDDDLRQSLEDRKPGDSISLPWFIDSLFTQTLEFLGPKVGTGVIYRPQEDDPEWLVTWRANVGHTLSPKKFYIGKDVKRVKDRGCAGEAFIEDEIRKFNIINQKTGEGDHPCKKVFEDYARSRGGPDYLSSVSSPIHWNKKIIGVLCIDSMESDFFSDEIAAMIQVFADKIGDALYLHGELE
jgi:hypothetical protein